MERYTGPPSPPGYILPPVRFLLESLLISEIVHLILYGIDNDSVNRILPQFDWYQMNTGWPISIPHSSSPSPLRHGWQQRQRTPSGRGQHSNAIFIHFYSDIRLIDLHLCTANQGPCANIELVRRQNLKQNTITIFHRLLETCYYELT